MHPLLEISEIDINIEKAFSKKEYSPWQTHMIQFKN